MARRPLLHAAALAALVLAASPPAQAEPVRLLVGAAKYGQGWMYLDFDRRCKVVTAGHVVSVNDQPTTAIVRDGRGRELRTELPEVLSLDPDIAVLPVITGGRPEDCSRSRLSQIGIERRANALAQGRIETTLRSEIVTVPVERTAKRIDRGNGYMFAVRSRTATYEIVEGWSGSIVRDDEGPIGIVVDVDVDLKEGHVVRLDVLATLAKRAWPAHRADARAPVVVLAGATSDSAAGPEGMFDGARPPWKVRPAGRVVSVVVGNDRGAPVSGVVVSLAENSPGGLAAIDVHVGPGGNDERNFVLIKSCKAQGRAKFISCAFAAQSHLRLRIDFRTTGPEEVLVRQLQLQ